MYWSILRSGSVHCCLTRFVSTHNFRMPNSSFNDSNCACTFVMFLHRSWLNITFVHKNIAKCCMFSLLNHFSKCCLSLLHFCINRTPWLALEIEIFFFYTETHFKLNFLVQLFHLRHFILAWSQNLLRDMFPDFFFFFPPFRVTLSRQVFSFQTMFWKYKSV